MQTEVDRAKILSRIEIIQIGFDRSFFSDDLYWPCWLRKALSMIITSIDQTIVPKNDIERLVNVLRFRENPITPEDRHAIRLLHRLFLHHNCDIRGDCTQIQFPRDDPFSIYERTDMFASVSGDLEPALLAKMQQIYHSLDIQFTDSHCNGSSLDLSAPTVDKISELRNAIPASFRKFCSFRLD